MPKKSTSTHRSTLGVKKSDFARVEKIHDRYPRISKQELMSVILDNQEQSMAIQDHSMFIIPEEAVLETIENSSDVKNVGEYICEKISKYLFLKFFCVPDIQIFRLLQEGFQELHKMGYFTVQKARPTTNEVTFDIIEIKIKAEIFNKIFIEGLFQKISDKYQLKFKSSPFKVKGKRVTFSGAVMADTFQ